ncbi:MAG: hypothetical protein ABH822_02260 [Patescibacteria group bacterium]
MVKKRVDIFHILGAVLLLLIIVFVGSQFGELVFPQAAETAPPETGTITGVDSDVFRTSMLDCFLSDSPCFVIANTTGITTTSEISDTSNVGGVSIIPEWLHHPPDITNEEVIQYVNEATFGSPGPYASFSVATPPVITFGAPPPPPPPPPPPSPPTTPYWLGAIPQVIETVPDPGEVVTAAPPSPPSDVASNSITPSLLNLVSSVSSPPGSSVTASGQASYNIACPDPLPPNTWACEKYNFRGNNDPDAVGVVKRIDAGSYVEYSVYIIGIGAADEPFLVEPAVSSSHKLPRLLLESPFFGRSRGSPVIGDYYHLLGRHYIGGSNDGKWDWHMTIVDRNDSDHRRYWIKYNEVFGSEFFTEKMDWHNEGTEFWASGDYETNINYRRWQRSANTSEYPDRPWPFYYNEPKLWPGRMSSGDTFGDFGVGSEGRIGLEKTLIIKHTEAGSLLPGREIDVWSVPEIDEKTYYYNFYTYAPSTTPILDTTKKWWHEIRTPGSFMQNLTKILDGTEGQTTTGQYRIELVEKENSEHYFFPADNVIRLSDNNWGRMTQRRRTLCEPQCSFGVRYETSDNLIDTYLLEPTSSGYFTQKKYREGNISTTNVTGNSSASGTNSSEYFTRTDYHGHNSGTPEEPYATVYSTHNIENVWPYDSSRADSTPYKNIKSEQNLATYNFDQIGHDFYTDEFNQVHDNLLISGTETQVEKKRVKQEIQQPHNGGNNIEEKWGDTYTETDLTTTPTKKIERKVIASRQTEIARGGVYWDLRSVTVTSKDDEPIGGNLEYNYNRTTRSDNQLKVGGITGQTPTGENIREIIKDFNEHRLSISTIVNNNGSRNAITMQYQVFGTPIGAHPRRFGDKWNLPATVIQPPLTASLAPHTIPGLFNWIPWTDDSSTNWTAPAASSMSNFISKYSNINSDMQEESSDFIAGSGSSYLGEQNNIFFTSPTSPPANEKLCLPPIEVCQ